MRSEAEGVAVGLPVGCGLADGRAVGLGGDEGKGNGAKVLVEAAVGAAAEVAGDSGVAWRSGATQLADIPAVAVANQYRNARRDQYGCDSGMSGLPIGNGQVFHEPLAQCKNRQHRCPGECLGKSAGITDVISVFYPALRDLALLSI